MTSEMIILCLAAFAAGFIDSIVGGGGLVQTPTILVTFPKQPLAVLLGTTKIPAICGTSIAALQYALKVSIKWRLLALMLPVALISAYAGSRTVAHVSSAFMKPVFFCLLILVAVYTYRKKDFGATVHRTHSVKTEMLYGGIFALILGFYDGFIGPGAGSFLVLFFISIIGFDFLRASAHAKMVNLATNLGSIIYFTGSGEILYHYAIPMAVFNLTGSILGTRLALLKGNKFIRVFFLLVVSATIVRFGYDIFFKK